MKNMENDEDLLISLEIQNFMDASQKKRSDQQRPQRLINQLAKNRNPVNLIQVATPGTGQVFGHPQPADLNRGRQMQQINTASTITGHFQQFPVTQVGSLGNLIQDATPGTDNSEQYRVKGATLSDLRKQRKKIQTHNGEVTTSRQYRPIGQNLTQQLTHVGSSSNLIQVASPGAGQVFGHQQSDDAEENTGRRQHRPSHQILTQQLAQFLRLPSPETSQVFGYQQSDDSDENTGRRQHRPSHQILTQQLTQVGSSGNLIRVASPGADQVFGHQQSDDSEGFCFELGIL